jgi:hypothetical protein
LKTGNIGYSAAFEEVLAWIWAGETSDSYSRLGTWQKAQIIAAYRAENRLAAIQNEETARRMRALAARQRERTRGG